MYVFHVCFVCVICVVDLLVMIKDNQNKYLRASFLFKLIKEKFGSRLFTGLEAQKKNPQTSYIKPYLAYLNSLERLLSVGSTARAVLYMDAV